MKPTPETVNRVTRALGMEVRPDAVSASVSPPPQTLIPFLKSTVDDERTWARSEEAGRVRFDQLTRITQRAGVPRFPNLKSLEAVVNPRTQIIYKVMSEWPADVAPIAPFPSAPEEERQLRNLGERFVALPELEPAVDFYNALKQIDVAGLAPVQEARQVIAYLVTHHTRRYGPRPVWIIQTRGIELPLEGYAAEVDIPIDARNHMRHVIDAMTGAWLYSDTAPQPVD